MGSTDGWIESWRGRETDGETDGPSLNICNFLYVIQRFSIPPCMSWSWFCLSRRPVCRSRYGLRNFKTFGASAVTCHQHSRFICSKMLVLLEDCQCSASLWSCSPEHSSTVTSLSRIKPCCSDVRISDDSFIFCDCQYSNHVGSRDALHKAKYFDSMFGTF